jgi:hypothetical protein
MILTLLFTYLLVMAALFVIGIFLLTSNLSTAVKVGYTLMTALLLY